MCTELRRSHTAVFINTNYGGKMYRQMHCHWCVRLGLLLFIFGFLLNGHIWTSPVMESYDSDKHYQRKHKCLLYVSSLWTALTILYGISRMHTMNTCAMSIPNSQWSCTFYTFIRALRATMCHPSPNLMIEGIHACANPLWFK